MADFWTFLKSIEFSAAGSAASLLGLIVSIFTLAYVQISKKAAQEAVKKVRADIGHLNEVAGFTAAIATMEEIKRLHRESAWSILPERYSVLRKHLISIKEAAEDLTAEQKKTLQSAIQFFAGLESQVEVALSQKADPHDVPGINKQVSRQIDKLQSVLANRSNNIGR